MGARIDFTDCVSFNTRKTARLLAQAYDRALEPVGLKSTQFSILAVAAGKGPLKISELARALELERTTLTRNLGVLEREGLVTVDQGEDARSKAVTVTRRGRERLRKAAPRWADAQARILERLGEGRWRALRKELDEVREVVRTAL